MGDQHHKSELTFTSKQLCEMMKELAVDHNVTKEGLKAAYKSLISVNHPDKGGNLEKSQKINMSYRVLKCYLESQIKLPSNAGFFATTSDHIPPFRNCCRPGYQAPRSAKNAFASDDSGGEFEQARTRRRNRGGQRAHASTHNQEQQNNGADENDEHETFAPFGKRGQKARRAAKNHGTAFNGRKGAMFSGTHEDLPFVNNHTYAPEDYSTYDDPMEKPDRQKDNFRRIRGGLILFKDFSRSERERVDELMASQYHNLKEGGEYALLTDPQFKHLLEKLMNREEKLDVFAEGLSTFIKINWAFSGEGDISMMINKVPLRRMTEGEDTLYEAILSEKEWEKHSSLLSPGLHMDVRSFKDKQLTSSAVIDSVNDETHSMVLFFIEPYKIARIVALSQNVNLGINTSSFVYRTVLRSIEMMVRFDRKNYVFPELKYSETLESFRTKRDSRIPEMPFREEDNFNQEQRQAVYSIVNKCHHPYPFVLFGPPGTGKTVTLAESIRHVIAQSPQNRVLVCTPSRMAADNIAETILTRTDIHPKYLFRMHSLSTTTKDDRRNQILKPISYLPKEAKGRFFGIPHRRNLKLFRVVISTLTTASYLISAGGLRGFYTHIFIDEAGQATEPDSWIPIGGLAGPNTSVIFAGDPMQLGPVMDLQVMAELGYDVSMIRRLMQRPGYRFYAEKEDKINIDDRVFIALKQTYRSNYPILRPCSFLFYNNLLRSSDEDDELYKLSEWEGLPTKRFPIIFHSSHGSQEEMVEHTKSCSNPVEISIVVYYIKRLLDETETTEEAIGVITPYKSQVYKLRHALKEHPGITVDSVEGFQGSERDVIIISTVRTGNSIGFLRCDLRLNTSISRARSLLIVIGDEYALSQHNTWHMFITYCQYHGGFRSLDGTDLGESAEKEQDKGLYGYGEHKF